MLFTVNNYKRNKAHQDNDLSNFVEADTVFMNSISNSVYDFLVGMDFLQLLDAIIHALIEIVDFEEPSPNTLVNNAVLHTN
uniref:Gag-pol polyprotein n=1 Tax=Strongyloides venezuelensis TaxID=75913 RepID=A0A0K0FRW1_STRVS